ncbi:PREDICTED: MRG/MORF4L-binding protein [Ceratosolen solmsi marchali]|uniref:MRG/MORF4L-binding protein n=1 Tax=Ceratosolen solmsi marchali TaxID=326594 RepID=A0AAJ6YU46_9HYME|nr:PREDICTED: MRG/MORF4L-binding protein [Ceratosolen solmsi marchali]
MAVKEKQADSAEEIEWNVENEIQLFFAMNGHKPVGVNKYFHMVCIWEKFRAAIHKDVSLKAIWDHLKSMYDLMTLDDMEDVPFPSNETDFLLPESEFSELMKSRKKEDTDQKPKEIKEKVKEIKKEKEVKEVVKKEITLRDTKTVKEVERKKEEIKKVVKEPELKKENKQRETKEIKKEQKATKGRLKGKEEPEDTGPPVKKERKDSEPNRESLKRALKRPTRQSIDSTSKASPSPRDTPPPKRRRI